MNYEINSFENICSIRFPDLQKELVDIDCLFRQTNCDFYDLLVEMGIDTDFDFKKAHNKKLYTHSFIKTVTDYFKNKEDDFRPYFYSNLLTKDTFRNNLIKKIRRAFGFLVWEDIYEFEIIHEKLEDCDVNTKLIGLFNTEKKIKSFKYVKRFLEKEGLTHLNEVYFKDLGNKIQIYL